MHTLSSQNQGTTTEVTSSVILLSTYCVSRQYSFWGIGWVCVWPYRMICKTSIINPIKILYITPMLYITCYVIQYLQCYTSLRYYTSLQCYTITWGNLPGWSSKATNWSPTASSSSCSLSARTSTSQHWPGSPWKTGPTASPRAFSPDCGAPCFTWSTWGGGAWWIRWASPCSFQCSAPLEFLCSSENSLSGAYKWDSYCGSFWVARSICSFFIHAREAWEIGVLDCSWPCYSSSAASPNLLSPSSLLTYPKRPAPPNEEKSGYHQVSLL